MIDFEPISALNAGLFYRWSDQAYRCLKLSLVSPDKFPKQGRIDLSTEISRDLLSSQFEVESYKLEL